MRTRRSWRHCMYDYDVRRTTDLHVMIQHLTGTSSHLTHSPPLLPLFTLPRNFSGLLQNPPLFSAPPCTLPALLSVTTSQLPSLPGPSSGDTFDPLCGESDRTRPKENAAISPCDVKGCNREATFSSGLAEGDGRGLIKLFAYSYRLI
jgi:hypothetical protein